MKFSLFKKEKVLVKKDTDLLKKPDEEGFTESSFDNMTYDQLSIHYNKLQDMYLKNPTEKTIELITKIGNKMNNIIEKQKQEKENKTRIPTVSPDDIKLDELEMSEAESMARLYAREKGKKWENLKPETQKKLIVYYENKLGEVRESLAKVEESAKQITENDMTETYIEELKSIIKNLNDVNFKLEARNEELEKKVNELENLLDDAEKTIRHEVMTPQETQKSDHSETSMKAYAMISKKKDPPKPKDEAYELKNLELYCFNCKHKIQEHMKNGESNGCVKCGCLKSVEEIAKENDAPLITKKEYTEIRKVEKPSRGVFNSINLKQFKHQSTNLTSDNEDVIQKQAKQLSSMVKKRADDMQESTEKRLNEKKKKLGNIDVDGCTCGHQMKLHFDNTGFCIVKDCVCNEFRSYP